MKRTKAAGRAQEVVSRKQPFHQTRLGKLPPEIRQQIFVNLHATPPPYAGREVSVPYHLKASHLAILCTCRQIYLEAFTVFYGRKSYYAANAQELIFLLNFGRSGKPGPEGFRTDVVTTLCVKDLIIREENHTTTGLRRMFLGNTLGLRPATPATQPTLISYCLDPRISSALVNLKSWTALDTICICMRAGELIEYVVLLAQIVVRIRTPGFEKASLETIDDHKWAVHLEPQDLQERRSFHSLPKSLWSHLKIMDKNEKTRHNQYENERKWLASRLSALSNGDEHYVEINVVRHAHGYNIINSPSEDKSSVKWALLSLKPYISLGAGLTALVLAYYLYVNVLDRLGNTAALQS